MMETEAKAEVLDMLRRIQTTTNTVMDHAKILVDALSRIAEKDGTGPCGVIAIQALIAVTERRP